MIISKKAFRGLIALILIVIVVAAAWFAGWQITGKMNPAEWVTKQPEKDPTEEIVVLDGVVYGSDGEVVDFTDELKTISPRTVAFYSTSLRATGNYLVETSEITLTAKIKPDNADDKRVTWTSTNPEAVSVTASDEDSRIAVVKYIQDFTEQVIIRATSVDNPEAYAETTVDCIVPVENVKCRFMNSDGAGTNIFQLGSTYSCVVGSSTSGGSVKGTYEISEGIFYSNQSAYTSHYSSSNPLKKASVVLNMGLMFSFSGNVFTLPSTPSAVFNVISVLTAYEFSQDEISLAVEEYDNIFKNVCHSSTNFPAFYRPEIKFNYMYNGVLVNSGTASVSGNLLCDVSNIWTSVEDITVSGGGAVLMPSETVTE